MSGMAGWLERRAHREHLTADITRLTVTEPPGGGAQATGTDDPSRAARSP